MAILMNSQGNNALSIYTIYRTDKQGTVKNGIQL